MPLRAGTGASATSTGTPDDAVQSLAAPPEDFEPTREGRRHSRCSPFKRVQVEELDSASVPALSGAEEAGQVAAAGMRKRHALPRLRITGEINKPSTLSQIKMQRNNHSIFAMFESTTILGDVQIETVTMQLTIRNQI